MKTQDLLQEAHSSVDSCMFLILLQHIHQRGCEVLLGLDPDPVRDQRGLVSSHMHPGAAVFKPAV